MKKIFVLMICVLTSQNVSAAEIRPADIEYRYEGMANSGSLSHSFMIREQETKRIKLTKKSGNTNNNKILPTRRCKTGTRNTVSRN
jgi:hypothetical protein